MPDFNPSVNDTITIAGETYRAKSHPMVPGFPYSQEGRKATVYQLAASNDYLFALKKFKPSFREAKLLQVTSMLAPLASRPGLEAAERLCIEPGVHDDLLAQYDDLEFAALMPWIFGSTWYDMVIGERKLGRGESVKLAFSLADVLAALEESNMAHCDIAAPNVIINLNQGSVHLIDLEDMYIPGLDAPDALPAGTEGYAHGTAGGGLWKPTADRFAGAVLIAEMAAWHSPDIRREADEEHYFDAKEMQQDGDRYQLMIHVLNDLDPRLVDLFEQAWYAVDLSDCPPLKDWHEVFSDLHHSEQVAGVVSDWTPLAMPGIAPAEDDSVQARAANGEAAQQPAPAPEQTAPHHEEEQAEQESTSSPAPPAPDAQPDTDPAPSQVRQLPTFDAPMPSRHPSGSGSGRQSGRAASVQPPTRPTPSQSGRRPITPPSGGQTQDQKSPVVEWRSLDVKPEAPSNGLPGSGSRPITPPAEETSPPPESEPDPAPEPSPVEREIEAPADDPTSEEAFAEEEAWDDGPAVADLQPPAEEIELLEDVIAEEEPAYSDDQEIEELELLDEALSEPEAEPVPEPDRDPAGEVWEEAEAWEEDAWDEPADDSHPAGLLKPMLDLSHIDNRGRPHLVWTESAAADYYELEEAETPDFADAKDYRIKGGDTRWSPGLFWRKAGRMYYRVRAVDADDTPGPWSEPVRVRIGRG